MKLVTFEQGEAVHYGAVKGDRVIDLTRRIGKDFPDIVAFIARDGRSAAEALLRAQSGDHAYEQLTLLPVVPNPGRIFCIGLNYADHIAEADKKLGGREAPKKPMVFARWPESLAAHRAAIKRPRVSHQLDWEAELLVVIGKRAPRYTPVARALDHVFGYHAGLDPALGERRVVEEGREVARLDRRVALRRAGREREASRIVTRIGGGLRREESGPVGVAGREQPLDDAEAVASPQRNLGDRFVSPEELSPEEPFQRKPRLVGRCHRGVSPEMLNAQAGRRCGAQAGREHFFDLRRDRGPLSRFQVSAHRMLCAAEQARDHELVGFSRNALECDTDVVERWKTGVADFFPQCVEQERAQAGIGHRADVREHGGAARLRPAESAHNRSRDGSRTRSAAKAGRPAPGPRCGVRRARRSGFRSALRRGRERVRRASARSCLNGPR